MKQYAIRMQSFSDEFFMADRCDTEPVFTDINEPTAFRASLRFIRSGVRPVKHIRMADGMKPPLLPEKKKRLVLEFLYFVGGNSCVGLVFRVCYFCTTLR